MFNVQPPLLQIELPLAMRVGIVVSSNKFTGAAAVAEGWCRSLRENGVDARMLFVAGANLERRLSGADWADAGLLKERRIADIRHNLRAYRSFAADNDLVICHLPHDHFEAVASGAHQRTRLVRAFRRPRHMRRDPLHSALARRVAGALAPFNAAVRDTETLVRAPVAAIPAAVESRFDPDGGRDHELLRRCSGDIRLPVLGMVGKLAVGRGFETLLDTAAAMNNKARVLVVGHGELQPELERRVARLGLGARVLWAGKREEDLPDLYRAMDVVVFAAPGSDWGHRSITEAQSCGRPVVAVDWPGVSDLVEHRRTGFIVPRQPAAVASVVDNLVSDPDLAARVGAAAAATAQDRRLGPVGEQMARFLKRCR